MSNSSSFQFPGKRKLPFIWLVLLPSFFAFGQTPPIGERAPAIQIDRWLQPASPMALSQKPILLYAWSLNCEECLRAFHRIDSLSLRFSDRFNFVALSNDKPRWVRKFLRKNPVRAIFVSDDQQRTFESYQFQGLPALVIMTPDRIIRWAGHPREVTGALLESIHGLPLEQLTARGTPPGEQLLPPQLLTVEISRTFGPTEPRLHTQSNAITFSGYTLRQAIAYLSGSTQARMVFPPDSTLERINLHITSPELNFPALRQLALQQLLLIKGLKMEFREENREVFLFSRIDTGCLHQYLADPGVTGMNYELTDGKLSAANISLAMLANVLENHLGQIIDLGIEEDGRFNFELNVEDWESLRLVLEEKYGLTVEPATKKIDITEVRTL